LVIQGLQRQLGHFATRLSTAESQGASSSQFPACFPYGERFRMLCHQRFGPAFGTNHLSDVARLAFRGSVEEYIQVFQMRMAHAGHLEPL
jgi:hypothetical protein